MELWAGCVAGALEERDYHAKLIQAGFHDVRINPTRIYTAADAREFLMGSGVDIDSVAEQLDGKLMSAFVRATKAANGAA
jgi:hypothetical protein